MGNEWTDDWSDKFSVGVPVLDRQHRLLMSLIHDALSVALENPDHAIKFAMLLNEMRRYADIHFQTEEALLEKYAYPGLDLQREEHKGYRKQLATMQHNLEAGLIERVSVQDFLQEWWYNHVLVADMEYKDFMTRAIA